MNPQAESLPPPLRGSDPDSFTHHTVTVRWPRIARRTLSETGFPARINERLETLISEIPDRPVRPLNDPEAPDERLWNDWIEPHRGRSWLEIPWFFGETYFYRRMLEATGYFQPGAGWRVDPFSEQKERGFARRIDAVRSLASRRSAALTQDVSPTEELARLFEVALWGNQADLSMWGVGEDGPDHLGADRDEDHRLVNDTDEVLSYLEGFDRHVRVDIWADNSGFELVTDLALADGLLTAGWSEPVVIHVKAHPTFVSDAIVEDVHAMLNRMATDTHEATRALSGRLTDALAEGRLRLRDSLMWTSPLRGRELPASVRAELARADLVISKGDANYRRLVGDRHWPFTTPFAEVVSYFPTALLALRTLKAEVAVGLRAEDVEHLSATDPDWLTSGEWGVIQFAPGDGA